MTRNENEAPSYQDQVEKNPPRIAVKPQQIQI